MTIRGFSEKLSAFKADGLSELAAALLSNYLLFVVAAVYDRLMPSKQRRSSESHCLETDQFVKTSDQHH